MFRLVQIAGLSFFLLFYHLLDLPSALMGGNTAFGAYDFLALPTSLSVPLLLIFLCSRPLDRLSWQFRGILSFGFGVLGFLLVYMGNAAQEEALPTAVAAIFLLGISIVCGLSAWVNCLTVERSHASLLDFIYAFAVASLLQITLTILASPRIIVVCLAASLTLSEFCLALSMRNEGKITIGASPDVHRKQRFAGIFQFTLGRWQLLVGIFVASASLEIVRILLLGASGAGQPTLPLFAIGRFLSCIAAAVLFRRNLFLEGDRIMAILYLAIVLEFLLCPLFGTQHQALFLISSDAIVTLVVIICFASEFEISDHCRGISVAWLALFMGIMYLGAFLGAFISKYVASAFGLGHLGILVLAIAVIALVSLASIVYNFVGDRRMAGSDGKGDAGAYGAGGSQGKEMQVAVPGSRMRVAETAPSFGDAVRENAMLVEEYRISEREMDVLILVLSGHTVPTMATKLYISENTVRGHMKRIYSKLNVHSKGELLELMENLIPQPIPPVH